MNNFYLIDKPLEYSSFDIIRVLRKKLNIRKMWHTWTLDPLATGGLLIATWNYTKLIPYFEKDKKTYEFTINLDWVTDSFDLAEKINFLDKNLQEKYKKELTIEKIKEILQEKFIWKIKQLPPKYSALKINWKKACDLMREWKEVELKFREINIYNIDVVDFNYPCLSLRAEVSAWTYIRSIASDLWSMLWTGWYITKLRRTKIGDLAIDLWNKIDDLENIKALKIEDLFKNKKFIQLEEDILVKINNWLKIKGKFDFIKNEDLFVHQNWIVTNIVRYDWNILFAVRKI